MTQRKVWFREADQRVGRYGFEVLTSPDGMESVFRRTHMETDVMSKWTFTGETSLHAAMRRFEDEVLADMYG
jgi:hypothetical protein